MKRTPAVTSARERARVCGRRWRLPGVWTKYSCPAPAPDPAPAPAAASTRLRAARLTRLVLPRKSSVEKASGGGGSGSTMAGDCIVYCCNNTDE